MGPVGKNFAVMMLRLHRERGTSGQALEDHVGCPTSISIFAAACWLVIASMDTTVGLPGGAKIVLAGGRELVRRGRSDGRAGAHLLAPGPTPAAAGWGMNSTAIELNRCKVVEPAQQLMKFAARKGAWSY